MQYKNYCSWRFLTGVSHELTDETPLCDPTHLTTMSNNVKSDKTGELVTAYYELT